MLNWNAKSRRKASVATKLWPIGPLLNDAVAVLAAAKIDALDDRRDYGEVRWVTYGMLRRRMVVIAWTARAGARQIISMRKANERE